MKKKKVPVPIRYTNLFLASILFLLRRWREKIRLFIPLHVLDLAELIAIVSLVVSLIYLPSFFGIAFVQTIVDDEDTTTNNVAKEEEKKVDDDDTDIIASVVAGSVPSYSLESRLGDYRRAAGVRHEALKRITGRKIRGLPLDGFDYDSILRQCCEMPIGYVQLRVGLPLVVVFFKLRMQTKKPLTPADPPNSNSNPHRRRCLFLAVEDSVHEPRPGRLRPRTRPRTCIA